MKTISAELQAHLEGTLLTVCTLWRVTRTDGLVFGFTDHDQDVTFSGVTYLAATGHNPSNIRTTAQLSVDNLEVQSMLSASTITEADIQAGLWDFAEVLIQVVNYNDLTMGSMIQRQGWLGNIKTGRYNFVAELRGMMQPLQQQIGRVYAPGCDADFGDARCNVTGDYATWNPADTGSNLILSGGNLVVTSVGNTLDGARADTPIINGRRYFEVTMTVDKFFAVGVANANAAIDPPPWGIGGGYNSLVVNFNGYIISEGNIVGTVGGTFIQGDVIGVAVNTIDRTVSFRINNGAFTTISGANVPTGDLYPAIGQNNTGGVVTANFGETEFSNTVPTGYTGVDNGVLKYTVAGNVTSASSARVFTDSARVEVNGYFDGGFLTWTGGDNSGYSMEVKTQVGEVITLQQAMPNAIVAGDTYTLIAGCDKLRATCVSKFSNVVNFRGFPDLPGNDAMISGVL